MENELDRWVAAGYVRRLTKQQAAAAPCVSPAFVSMDRPGKPRLVVDLRQVNEHLRAVKFKYEALAEFMSSLLPSDHLISWDVKDAYHHVCIHPDDRRYLTFAVGGHTYEAVTMPFGLSVAPWAWTKIMRPVLDALRQAHFKLIGYVDDHGAAAPGRRPVSKRDAAAGFQYVCRLYDGLGIKMHPVKGEREGSQQLTLLGFVIDTANNELRLPPERVAKLRAAAAALLGAAGKNRRWVRRKLLQSVAGIIVSGSLAILEARLFARAIYDDLTATFGAGDCRLSHQSLRDLRYWANFGRHGHGRPLWPAPPAHSLHTDASTTGWGGVLDGKTPARGFFARETIGWHINKKEVAAIRYSLASLGDKLQLGARIAVVTDSQVALRVTNALVSRSPDLCAEVRRLYAEAQKWGVTLDASWIPSAENVWAEKLSRAKNSTDWQLARPFFLALDSAYGPHTIDRFATAANTQLPVYNGPARDQGAMPVDAFQQPWGAGGCNNWMNPPFDRVPLVLDKIKSDQATAIVILPVWQAQPWWAVAMSMANELCYLPRRAGLFFRGEGGVPGPRPHWTVCAARFIRGGRGQRRPRGPEPPSPSSSNTLAPGPVVRRLPQC